MRRENDYFKSREVKCLKECVLALNIILTQICIFGHNRSYTIKVKSFRTSCFSQKLEMVLKGTFSENEFFCMILHDLLTSVFLSSISPGNVPRFPCIVRCLHFAVGYNLLDVILEFWRFFLKLFKSKPNYIVLTPVTDIAAYLEWSSDHTLSFSPNLVKYRFKNMFLKEFITPSSTVILSTN